MIRLSPAFNPLELSIIVAFLLPSNVGLPEPVVILKVPSLIKSFV